MVRKSIRPSRQPILTENEIALQWELKRVRAELAAMEKKVQGQGPRPGDRLRGVPRAVFLLKIERLVRRWIHELIPERDRCRSCGGVSWWQFENAFVDMVKREGFDPDVPPTAKGIRGRDLTPDPQFDIARGFGGPAVTGGSSGTGSEADRDDRIRGDGSRDERN